MSSCTQISSDASFGFWSRCPGKRWPPPSSEVLVEASPDSVVWVDKSRTQSIASPNKAELASLSAALGTRFNLPMARVLRAKAVLFVEGDDGRMLRHVARITGASRLASESGVALMELRGFENWEHVEPFTWMSDQLLDGAVEIFVVLDRDFRAEAECKAIRAKLRAVNVRCHVWRRKELESYLLETPVIARIAGATEEWVEEALAEAADESEDYVFAQVAANTLGGSDTTNPPKPSPKRGRSSMCSGPIAHQGSGSLRPKTSCAA